MPEKVPITIFVVDNEKIIAETLALILNQSGFTTLAFTSAVEAIKALESQIPSLLISDVDMPGLNGIELAIRYKTLCPSCKLLLFSGHLATTELLEAARLQGHEFHILAKPVNPTDLIAAIRRL
jgi:CheY-like chemotaxis protein